MPLEQSQFYIFCSLFWNKTIDAVHLVCFEYKDAISIWTLIIIKDEYQSLYNIFIQVDFPLLLHNLCILKTAPVTNFYMKSIIDGAESHAMFFL